VFTKGDSIAAAFPGLMPNDADKRRQLAAQAVERLQRLEQPTALHCLAAIYLPIGDKQQSIWGCSNFRLGHFRLVEDGSEGRKPQKQQVRIDTVHHADQKYAIEQLLGCSIEWLVFADATEQKAAPNRGGRPGNSDSPKAQYMREMRELKARLAPKTPPPHDPGRSKRARETAMK